MTGPSEGDQTEEDGAGEEQKKGRKKGKIKESGAKEDSQVAKEAGGQMKKSTIRRYDAIEEFNVDLAERGFEKDEF